MILSTGAYYDTHTDSIQVGVLVQTDAQQSAADQLKSGTVEVLQNDSIIASEEFDSRHRVLWSDTDDDEPQDNGLFYFWLHHPPAQQNLWARVSVELVGRQQATERVPVKMLGSMSASQWQNPSLSGRPVITYDVDPSFP